MNAVDHAVGHVGAGAGCGEVIEAGEQLEMGLGVDEVNPDVVLRVSDVVRRGHNEAEAGQFLQHKSVVDGIVGGSV